MIGPINIPINAANPQLPLPPVYAFAGSPTSVRVVDAPRRIGNWQLTAVYITATYPDNSIVSAACVQNGCMWVGTIAGCQTAGSSSLGFTVSADGIDENGATVTGYVLGKGDLVVLSADGTITVDGVTYYLHLVDTLPETPHKGDVYNNNGAWEIYTGSAWVSLSVTVDSTVTSSSQNPVKSSGIWTALWGNLVTAYDSIAAWVTAQLGNYVTSSALTNTLASYLHKTGGTMTGNIWLSGGSGSGIVSDSGCLAISDGQSSGGIGSNASFPEIIAAIKLLNLSVYSNTTTYAVGDLCWYRIQGTVYVRRCKQATQGNNPLNTTYWENVSLLSLLANYLPLSGGVMTGTIKATSSTQSLSGIYAAIGIPSDSMSADAHGIEFHCNGPDTIGLVANWDNGGTQAAHLQLRNDNYNYSDTVANLTDLDAYLPLSGGTMTDALKICEPLYNTAGVVLGDTYVSPGPTYLNPYGVSHESGYTGISEMSGAKWDNIIAAANGNLAAYVKPTDLANYLPVNGSRPMTGNLEVYGSMMLNADYPKTVTLEADDTNNDYRVKATFPLQGPIVEFLAYTSDLRYALGSAITASATLADRTANRVTASASNTTQIVLTFPSAVSGKVRDFTVLVTRETGDTGGIAFTTPTNATIYGDGFSTAVAEGKTILYSITEIADNTWYTRAIEMEVAS